MWLNLAKRLLANFWGQIQQAITSALRLSLHYGPLVAQSPCLGRLQYIPGIYSSAIATHVTSDGVCSQSSSNLLGCPLMIHHHTYGASREPSVLLVHRNDSDVHFQHDASRQCLAITASSNTQGLEPPAGGTSRCQGSQDTPADDISRHVMACDLSAMCMPCGTARVDASWQLLMHACNARP